MPTLANGKSKPESATQRLFLQVLPLATVAEPAGHGSIQVSC